MLLLYLLPFGAAGFVIWKKWFQKPAGSSPIRTLLTPFQTRGNQAKPTDLLQELGNVDKEMLERRGAFFEFYPNQKVVALMMPPDTQIYCHCNLMQYMDLTRAIEKKIL